MNSVDKCVFLTQRPHFNRHLCARHYVVEVHFQTATFPTPNTKKKKKKSSIFTLRLPWRTQPEGTRQGKGLFLLKPSHPSPLITVLALTGPSGMRNHAGQSRLISNIISLNKQWGDVQKQHTKDTRVSKPSLSQVRSKHMRIFYQKKLYFNGTEVGFTVFQPHGAAGDLWRLPTPNPLPRNSAQAWGGGRAGG